MTKERIVTGIEVTSGEAPDGKFLKSLIEKSENAGLVQDANTIILSTYNNKFEKNNQKNE